MRSQEQDPRRAELRSATDRCDLLRLFQRDLDRFYQVSFYLTADAGVAEQVVLRAFEALAAYPRGVSVIDALKEIAIATVKSRRRRRIHG